MHAPVLLIVLFSELCRGIRVPVVWSDSVVNRSTPPHDPLQESSQDTQKQKPIPAEYFVYTAEKPQFASEIAAFHGVPNPNEHYKAYPILPYTGHVTKPVLGNHRVLDQNRDKFKPFQQYIQKSEAIKAQGSPIVDYEVFHPYNAELPALRLIYKDPILGKIRDDIRDSQKRLQNYEKEAGKPNIEDGEYLEKPEETDRKKIPQKNIPAPYEIHRPHRRPVYYSVPPKFNQREQILNQKFKHPWNEHNAKIRPAHYRPIKNHLQKLRQHHAVKFDDERNEYPQLPPPQHYAEPLEGYDIYEKGKQNYINLRNNVDESINKAVKENRPTIYQKLELQNNGDKTVTQISDNDNDDEEEEEFVPIKNYAQVRKTETFKHLPREAAFDDAESFDELRNAPRLREAVKSTKAQTVYTEEGYEDAAYDHAGEQKHASENEGHGGYLKENELSGGKFKTPSVKASYEDGRGNEYRDQIVHGKKWKDNNKDTNEETESEDFSEDEYEKSIEADIYQDVTGERNKRANDLGPNKTSIPEIGTNINSESASESVEDVKDLKNDTIVSVTQDSKNLNDTHGINKRETNFKIPELNLNSTFLTEEELIEMAKFKFAPPKEDIKKKYPYYFQNLTNVHKDSPLRYAENLKLIPKKSQGGTEFYDSRSRYACDEVDDKVDALPEKLKKQGHPDEDEEGKESKQKADFESIKENPRLKGLGDKIDCFKTKYFGENPLDSPFFKEGLIASPEPVTVPSLSIFTLKIKEPKQSESKISDVYRISEKLKNGTIDDVSSLLEKLMRGQKELQETLVNTNNKLRTSIGSNQSTSLLPASSADSPIIQRLKKAKNESHGNSDQETQQSNLYIDIIDNIRTNRNHPLINMNLDNNAKITETLLDSSSPPSDITFSSFQNVESVTKMPLVQRKKRASPFVYEPYKIIRDSKAQDSKKTTTTNVVSPLIKQLQTSRVVDKVPKTSQEKEQPVKRNVSTRTYKDIGRKDREKTIQKENNITNGHAFVDVSEDPRRGEPRYELRPANHKPQYTPVENKKSMSVEDYAARKNITGNETDKIKPEETKVKEANTTTVQATEESKIHPQIRTRQNTKQRRPTLKPFYDVSQFLPKSEEVQKSSASNTVTRVIKGTTTEPRSENKKPPPEEVIESEDDYEEYDDEEGTTTSTTTTTARPHFRRRRTRPTTSTTSTTTTTTTTSTTTTTHKPPNEEEESEPELPKLRLVTRFRNSPSTKFDENNEKHNANPKHDDRDEASPKYREKKKKTTKSTLVTDTKSYGDDDDDMREEEVDALIGIRHNMDDYKPLYEKEHEQIMKEREREASGSTEEDDDEEFDDEDDDDDEFDEGDDDEEDEEYEPKQHVTTPEPTKRTLVRTTEAPKATTEARSAKLELKPLVMKKKIEIHKELPVNKTSPHVTQFKQDIKEVEIIKELPSKTSKKKPSKNLEALELYRDENLAKDINKLGGVEVFKEDLDITNGPRHGGNYRSARIVELEDDNISTPKPLRDGNAKGSEDDAETSQSKNTKLVDLGDALPVRRMHGGNLRALSEIQRSRNSERSANIETLDDNSEDVEHRTPVRNKSRRRNSRRNEKIIEFDDDRDDHDQSPRTMHGGNFKSYGSRGRPMHGGNYRSAKIVQSEEEKPDSTSELKESKKDDARQNAAVLLNSFAQAVPILTTTPAYILDPSKRMYYYVD